MLKQLKVMSEEKGKRVLIVGDPSVGHKFSDIIGDDGELHDIKIVSSASTTDTLFTNESEEVKQLLQVIESGVNERLLMESLSKPLSGQESRRQRRKSQRKKK